jgi:hypothetical protein
MNAPSQQACKGVLASPSQDSNSLESFSALQLKWGGLCTKHQAAALCGLSNTWVRQLCRSGQVVTVRFSGAELVALRSLIEYAAMRRRGRR